MINYNVPGLVDVGAPQAQRPGDLARFTRARSQPGTTRPSRTSTRASHSRPTTSSPCTAPTAAVTRSSSATYLSDADPSGWGSSIGYGTTSASPPFPMRRAKRQRWHGYRLPGHAWLHRLHRRQLPVQDAGAQASVRPSSERVRSRSNRSMPDDTAEAKALEGKTPANESLSLVYDNAQRLPDRQLRVRHHPTQGKQRPPGRSDESIPVLGIDPKNGSSNSFVSQVNFQPLTPGVAELSAAQIAQISG